MVEKGLDGFFEAFLRKGSVFLDKRALQSSYTPETIVHREEQTKQLANILAPILKSEKPSNTFVYGKTGTGKTLTVRHITQKITDISKQENLSVQEKGVAGIVALRRKIKLNHHLEIPCLFNISKTTIQLSWHSIWVVTKLGTKFSFLKNSWLNFGQFTFG